AHGECRPFRESGHPLSIECQGGFPVARFTVRPGAVSKNVRRPCGGIQAITCVCGFLGMPRPCGDPDVILDESLTARVTVVKGTHQGQCRVIYPLASLLD